MNKKPEPSSLRLVLYPDPVLEKACKEVDDPNDPYVQECVKRMKKVLKSMPNGIGLAASQVGLLLRIYVAYDFEKLDKTDTGTIDNIRAYINPVFDPNDSLPPICENEGCLSFPGIRGSVFRPPSGKLTYFNEQGKQVEEELQGLKARCSQHEIDHLNGISIIQSMTDECKAKNQNQVKRLAKLRK